MANVQKHTKGACGHMCKHYERAQDETGEYVKFGNQDINLDQTNLNYNLAPNREISQGDFIKKRCSEVKCLNRDNVNVMCSWVVTAPKTIAGNAEQEKKFFKETYQFLSARYGNENVVSAYVHMDEKTPHIHFAFVPVVQDKKKGHLKVSAYECINKTELNRFHGELEKHMQKAFGFEIGILNEATKEGNKTVEELKQETKNESLKQIKEERKEVKNEIEILNSEKKRLQTEIKGLRGDLIKAHDIQSIKPEKTITGAVKNVTVEQVEQLQRTALKAYSLERENRNLKTELKEYQEKAEPVKMGLKEKIGAIETSKKLEALEKAVSEEPKEIQQRIKLVANAFEKGIKQEKNKVHEEER